MNLSPRQIVFLAIFAILAGAVVLFGHFSGSPQ